MIAKINYCATDRTGTVIDSNGEILAKYRIVKNRRGFSIKEIYASNELDKEEKKKLFMEMSECVLNCYD